MVAQAPAPQRRHVRPRRRFAPAIRMRSAYRARSRSIRPADPASASSISSNYDFLKAGEVVLTFDDGPWQDNTPTVLEALADHCVKATFFSIGKHATYYPEILKQVAAAGHTVGTHTWSHVDLDKKSMSFEEAKDEIEMGISAVHLRRRRADRAVLPLSALQHPPELVTYLGERNIAIFSTDIDSFDFKMRKPEQVIKSVMEKLEKHGKGIVLMHDFQHATAEGIASCSISSSSMATRSCTCARRLRSHRCPSTTRW